jgi:DNA-binding NarL/FixJ family response regulator
LRALGLIRDLFFRSKIDAVARAIGAEIVYASTLDGALRECAESPPALVLVDLSGNSAPASEIAQALRVAARNARLVGFASHVDLKALGAARAAGFDLTLSREEFTSRLPELLGSDRH